MPLLPEPSQDIPNLKRIVLAFGSRFLGEGSPLSVVSSTGGTMPQKSLIYIAGLLPAPRTLKRLTNHTYSRNLCSVCHCGRVLIFLLLAACEANLIGRCSTEIIASFLKLGVCNGFKGQSNFKET